MWPWTQLLIQPKESNPEALGSGPLDFFCGRCRGIFFSYLFFLHTVIIGKRTLRGYLHTNRKKNSEGRKKHFKLLWGIPSARRIMIIATCRWPCTHFTTALYGNIPCLYLTNEQKDSKKFRWISNLPRAPHPRWDWPQCCPFLSVVLVPERGK